MPHFPQFPPLPWQTFLSSLGGSRIKQVAGHIFNLETLQGQGKELNNPVSLGYTQLCKLKPGGLKTLTPAIPKEWSFSKDNPGKAKIAERFVLFSPASRSTQPLSPQQRCHQIKTRDQI